MTSADPTTMLSAEELQDMLVEGAEPLMLDVRSAAEHRGARIPGSVLVPEDLVRAETQALAEALDEADRPVVLLCQAGPRSQQAHDRLVGAGAEGLRVLDGGLVRYRAVAGDGAVELGSGPWAMERQVRMAAGSLVLAGLVGGRFLGPKARVVSGAIASGLIYSAASDTCGMAKVLARMPWNQSQDAPIGVQDVLTRLN
ncbi:rhodanese-like domain-containing protein [Nesterenkonia sp. HG001]|uniref:rhodanese-like domain-containing protein n=1 Tax=Nesterenkonia sp. HG001 TaxID=2983207 RepID=UPI002AC76D79|nr:rhodanese-like domain-containing protein [Nesterenkonia sp. HG001]MDZ5076349.1 rhodanese-like domain-containing protein [Nesterenkonia sp. HG001]